MKETGLGSVGEQCLERREEATGSGVLPFLSSRTLPARFRGSLRPRAPGRPCSKARWRQPRDSTRWRDAVPLMVAPLPRTPERRVSLSVRQRLAAILKHTTFRRWRRHWVVGVAFAECYCFGFAGAIYGLPESSRGRVPDWRIPALLASTVLARRRGRSGDPKYHKGEIRMKPTES